MHDAKHPGACACILACARGCSTGHSLEEKRRAPRWLLQLGAWRGLAVCRSSAKGGCTRLGRRRNAIVKAKTKPVKTKRSKTNNSKSKDKTKGKAKQREAVQKTQQTKPKRSNEKNNKRRKQKRRESKASQSEAKQINDTKFRESMKKVCTLTKLQVK